MAKGRKSGCRGAQGVVTIGSSVVDGVGATERGDTVKGILD